MEPVVVVPTDSGSTYTKKFHVTPQRAVKHVRMEHWCGTEPNSNPRPAKGMACDDSSPKQLHLEVSSTTNKTAYRLPKLHRADTDEQSSKSCHRMWGHHGYNYYSKTGRQTQMSLGSHQIYTTPHLITLEKQQCNLISNRFPSFGQAIISPTQQTQVRYYAGNVQDRALYKQMLSQNKSADSPMLNCHNNDLDGEVQGPLPTPVSHRLMCPPKSAQSIHWTLSPMKNLHYDRKGKSKFQGPYSREFAVTCMAPTNWLRMKLGRSKTTVV
ncbi:hypothetical protein LSH36_170g01009 [Paralvinella palmiformis]|uniref:Uncharacterized protein n=1 Tax=Paralvinella palmiformis TaxID=53620 RepID=A0AAD9N8X7_9ANNE|nr:hypothetical protein LSH36_170g01009 [Paralvinella palmiformis]